MYIDSEHVKFYLLANRQYYIIAQSTLDRYPECSLNKREYMCKYMDHFIVDYDPISFEAILELMRYGYQHVEDQAALYITAKYMNYNIFVKQNHYYFDKLVIPTLTNKDCVITFKLVSTGDVFHVLRSTLQRFPGNIFAEMTNEMSDISYIVDYNVDTFKWIINLFRGTNHIFTSNTDDLYKYTIDHEYNAHGEDTKQYILSQALTHMRLPDALTGTWDMILQQNALVSYIDFNSMRNTFFTGSRDNDFIISDDTKALYKCPEEDTKIYRFMYIRDIQVNFKTINRHI